MSSTATPETAGALHARHAAGGRPHATHATGFWFAASAYTALMAFGTVPTPLWPLYQVHDHFGATTVTLAFAVMVVGAAFAFTTLGHLSDRVGRRRVIVPALAVAMGGAVLMALWPALPGLIAGRLLTGVAIGLMASTSTAYLSDLYHQAWPGSTGSSTPATVATAANLGGLALGPLVAGGLAEWAPSPLRTSYIVVAAVMAVLLLAILASPETVDTTAAARTEPPVRFALRPGYGASFGGAAAVGFFAFAVMGLFSSLGAIIVRGQLHISSTFVAGVEVFTAFAASAVAQLALGRLSQPRLLATGTALFPAGLAFTTVSLYHPSLSLALVAAGFAGAGSGLLFKGAVTQAATAAAPASRAGVLAMFFVIAYLGMGLPSVTFSLVIQHAALRPSMIGFASALTAGAVVAVVTAVRSHARA
ncbi:MFS transporter [Streptomyces sp. NPDC020983]|uniref:MFS transporter n=1 Tax=Streptomyces sp. NPDC020983 TaxID=3365106 RepID=UPI00378BB073